MPVTHGTPCSHSLTVCSCNYTRLNKRTSRSRPTPYRASEQAAGGSGLQPGVKPLVRHLSCASTFLSLRRNRRNLATPNTNTRRLSCASAVSKRPKEATDFKADGSVLARLRPSLAVYLTHQASFSLRRRRQTLAQGDAKRALGKTNQIVRAPEGGDRALWHFHRRRSKVQLFADVLVEHHRGAAAEGYRQVCRLVNLGFRYPHG